MRALCLGGGPAGLYFAICMKLRDPAHDVTVLERNRAGPALSRLPDRELTDPLVCLLHRTYGSFRG